MLDASKSDFVPKESKWMILALCATIFGCTIQFGHGISVIDGIEPFISNLTMSVLTSRYHVSESKVEATENLVYTGMASIYVIGSIFGSFFVNFIAEKMGRKGGLMFNNIFIITGAVLQGISQRIHSFEVIYVGRFFAGIGSGVIIPISIIYLMEISTRKNRGKSAVANQIFISVGICFAQLLTFRQVFGVPSLWPASFTIMIIPALLSVVVLFFCPESPRWLLMKGRKADAYNALTTLRTNTDIEIEFNELVQDQFASTCTPLSIATVLTKKELRRPLCILVVVYFVQQFSGINMILAFSNKIYRDAGLSPENIQYAILGSGISLIISSSFAGTLIDTIGRKKLLLYPLAGIIAMLILVTVSLVKKIYVLSIVCIYIFMLCFSASLGVIPQTLMVEYFQQDARSAASSIGTFVFSLSNFTAFWIFRPFIANERIKNYVFVIFIVLCSLSLVYLSLVVVETVNRTFADINRDFNKQERDIKL